MARFLFCPAPEIGEVYPTIPVALELRSRGHEVVYLTTSAFEPDLRREGITCFVTGGGIYGAEPGLNSPRGSLAPLRAQVEQLDCVFREFPADVVVDGSFPFGPRIFSDLRGVLRASVHAGCFPIPTSEPLFPYGRGILPPTDQRGRMLARLATLAQQDMERGEIVDWDEARKSFGLRPCGTHPARTVASPYLILLATSPALEYPRADLPEQYWFAGPLVWRSGLSRLPERVAAVTDRKPVVFASQGTTYNDDLVILRLAFEALRDEPVQVVATTSRAFSSREFHPLPENVILERFLPFSEFVDRVSVAITHGGAGAVNVALSRGVPVIAMPLEADQFEVAARCVWSGAGQRMDPHTATPEQLRAAVRAALSDPRYRAGAGRIMKSCKELQGARLAGALLERLVEERKPVLRPLAARNPWAEEEVA